MSRRKGQLLVAALLALATGRGCGRVLHFAADEGSGSTAATATTSGGEMTSTPDDGATATGEGSGTENTDSEDCPEPLVHEGDLVVTDDTDPATLECIVRATGDLLVDHTQQLVDLALLEDLRRVDGQVHIGWNEELLALDGLANLELVGEVVVIGGNPRLEDLTALAGVRQLGGLSLASNDVLEDVTSLSGSIVLVESPAEGLIPLSVARNPMLVDLDGFLVVEDVTIDGTAFVNISYNDILENAAGLAPFTREATEPTLTIADSDALQEIGDLGLKRLGDLQIYRTPSLQSLAGLTGLEHARSLDINVRLDDLSGLDDLRTVEETLWIAGSCTGEGSGGVTSLAGLEQLESVGNLYVIGNDLLTGFQGLNSVSTVTGWLWISGNPMLPTAEAEAFAASITVEGDIEICDNLDGEPCDMPCPPAGD